MTTAELARDASSVPTMAQLHEPWGRRKGNHDRESLLRVDLQTTTTASFSDNEEQVRGENPKTTCGEAAEKNGSREKKWSSREKTKRRREELAKKEELLREMVGRRQDVLINSHAGWPGCKCVGGLAWPRRTGWPGAK